MNHSMNLSPSTIISKKFTIISKKYLNKLGVWFSLNSQENLDLNLTDRLKSMNTLMNIWKSRKLSIKGKITILRTLILPQVQFLFSMIVIPETILKRLDNMLFDFLWDSKPAKVKRSTIIAPIEHGGHATCHS